MASRTAASKPCLVKVNEQVTLGIIEKIVRVPAPDPLGKMGGYGLIRDASGREVFFVHTVLRGVSMEQLRKGQKVRFEMGEPLTHASWVAPATATSKFGIVPE